MDKDNENSISDFDNDPDFNANFYKNIEDALGNTSETAQVPEDKNETTPFEDTTAEKPVYDKAEDIVQPTEENVTESLQPGEEKRIESLQPEEDGVTENLQSTGDIGTEEIQADEEDASVIEEELIDINSSLAKQVSEEMDQNSAVINTKKKKRLHKIQSGVVLSLLCMFGFVFFFGFTKPGNSVLMRLGINVSGVLWDNMTNDFTDSSDVTADIDYLDDEDIGSDAPELDPSTIVWSEHPGDGRQEEGVYNILILGEEAIGMGKSRGRTDVIVIATLNTNNETVKLTSLMRDSFVQIPGYQDNKLNTAYEKGGVDLLYETIALNFDLKLDGCIMVNFKKFEMIIDEIGGIEITLTEGEAKYLNTTNYISDPSNRKVKEGIQLMNGNQVLGYSRVRKRSTITGKNNDYGRTDRHRIILDAIYEKCKSKSKTDLAAMMFTFLPMITTDIKNGNFQALLNAYINMNGSSKKIEQLRIPADNTFEDNIKVRGMSVLIPDFDANIEILHKFIFGEETPTGTSGETDGTTDTTDISH